MRAMRPRLGGYAVGRPSCDLPQGRRRTSPVRSYYVSPSIETLCMRWAGLQWSWSSKDELSKKSQTFLAPIELRFGEDCKLNLAEMHQVIGTLAIATRAESTTLLCGQVFWALGIAVRFSVDNSQYPLPFSQIRGTIRHGVSPVGVSVAVSAEWLLPEDA